MNAVELKNALESCCTSSVWVRRMLESAPFGDGDNLKERANDCWLGLVESDYLEAFSGHPKIGDLNSLSQKYASTIGKAEREQSGMQAATSQMLAKLKSRNEDYLDKFGFIFIVCATGKSAEEMLNVLEQRLENSPSVELPIAAEEQRKIFQIRLEQFVSAKKSH